MITERDIDLMMVEVENFVKQLLTEYTKGHLGDRFGEVGNGNIYDQAGRQPVSDSEEIRGINQLDIER